MILIRWTLSFKGMPRPKAVEEAIEQIYATFSNYPLPEDTHPCSCCHTPIANELLHAAPLRKMTWRHLSDYTNDAILTWGDVDCFKHFMPRILELTVMGAEHAGLTPSAPEVFRLFRRGEWRTWPGHEQGAVESLLAAVWHTVRSNPPIESGWIDVEDWICAISYCESDIKNYLDLWNKDERISAAWALSCLVLGSEIPYLREIDMPVWKEGQNQQDFIDEFTRTPTASPFWDECRRQLSDLLSWMRSPEALEKLRVAELSCNNEVLQSEFAMAQLCIREAPSMEFVRAYRDRLYKSAFWEGRTRRLY